MVIKMLRNFLYEPILKDRDVNDRDMLIIHKNILLNKGLLKSAFFEFYKRISELSDEYFKVDGIELELGSGAGFFRDFKKDLITTDVRRGDNIDYYIDAQSMDIRDNSVRCVYAINVFHHLQEPELFFSELNRVLRPGGGCILIEPHAGFISSTIHKFLHRDETFDTTQALWKNMDINGAMAGANQALAYIVFDRDIKLFEKLYDGKLAVVHTEYCKNTFRYLLSGGLNFRQFCPDFFEKMLQKIEMLLHPLGKHLTLHQIIIIKKIDDSAL